MLITFLSRKVLVAATLTFGFIIFVGCVTNTPKAVVNTKSYSENVPQRLVTYDWFKLTDGDEILGNNLYIYQSIQRAIDGELAMKGYKTPAAAPDIKVGMLIVTSRDGLNVSEDRYFGEDLLGERGVNASDAVPILPRQSLEEGTIVFDAVDARTMKLVWRGTVKTDVNRENSPELRGEKIAFIANRLLQRFPESRP